MSDANYRRSMCSSRCLRELTPSIRRLTPFPAEPMHADTELLDLAEDMEQLLRYDRQSIIQKWALTDVDTQRAARRQ